MVVTAYKSRCVRQGDNLFEILDHAIPALGERSVVAVSAKIVSIMEGRQVPRSVSKTSLIRQESDWYIPASRNAYGVSLTITNNTLIPNAGIDESNIKNGQILWPKDPQESAAKIWRHLQDRFHIRSVGVILTDSKTTPLRWGVTGTSIAYCGFIPLNDYTGTPDLFGRKFKHTKVNVADALAASAVYVMGEGNEQTPIAVLSDIGPIRFQNRPPRQDEVDALHIEKDADLYGPLLSSVKWKKGKQS